MIRRYLTMLSLSYAKTIVYMLQSTEYKPSAYLRWYWRTTDFRSVMYRRKLDTTSSARMLLIAVRLTYIIFLGAAALLLAAAYTSQSWLLLSFGLLLLVLSPVATAHLILIPVMLGDILIIKPKEKNLILRSKEIFKNHPGTVIAIAGSYGKTSMKEMLAAVLGEDKNIAITPANKNVAISHAVFASNLKGDEEFIIIEYGEGKSGDVRNFVDTTDPDIGIITGIAPAHLDGYRSISDAAKDIFSLAEGIESHNVYVNNDSQYAQPYIKDEYTTYDRGGVGDWAVKDVHVRSDGIDFKLTNQQTELQISSKLLGRHQIGPLALVAVLSLKLGVNEKTVIAELSKIEPYEHRMDYRTLHGALVIDDTYNGNIEGMKAGLALLQELPAKRRIYVTPGLVDQGPETEYVHRELGIAIGGAQPDVVVLMSNSATNYIIEGLKSVDFQKEIQIVDDPLRYYTNLEHHIAQGDVVLMQNDWTDNYN